MGYRGINVLQSGDRLVFRVSLKDAGGAKVTSGTTELRIFELQPDGSIKWYDFGDNTFKTGTPSDDETTLTHRQYTDHAGASQDTGLWTGALTTVSGFTLGGIYLVQVSNSGAFPESQEYQFQYGLTEGNLLQDIAKSEEGTNGTVWHVALEGDGGDNGNDGLSWATPKLSTKTAIEGASAGDVVRVGKGEHDVGANNITIPTGVKVKGAGVGLTTITGSRTDTAGVVQQSGNGSVLEGVTVENSSTSQQSSGIKVVALLVDGDYCTTRDVFADSKGGYGVHWYKPQNGFAERVTGIGPRYGQVWNDTQDWIGRDLVGETYYNCTVGASVGMHFTGSAGLAANRILLINPMASGYQDAQTAAAIGIRVNTGRVHVVDGVVEARCDAAEHANTQAIGVACTGLQAGDGQITLAGTRIHTVCGNGDEYDLQQDYSGVIGVGPDVDYDPDKVDGTVLNLGDQAARVAWNTASLGSPTNGSPYQEIDEIKAKTGLLGTGGVSASSPVATDGEITIYRNDTYDADESRAIEWTNSAGTWGGGDITGATVAFRAYHERTDTTISLSGSVVTATGTQKVRVEMSSTDSAEFDDGRTWVYQVRLTLTNGHIETIIDSTVTAMATLF